MIMHTLFLLNFTGIAYAILATLPAVYGLYVDFVTTLVYAVLGTSKHISIGMCTSLTKLCQIVSNCVKLCQIVSN